MKAISIVDANYAGDLKVELVFNDKKRNLIDFEFFFKTHSHPQFNKYRKPEQFKKFKIENGNVVWGKDWDMIFPVYDLYKGKIEA
jgi:Protein of unknown function (DUF2442)